MLLNIYYPTNLLIRIAKGILVPMLIVVLAVSGSGQLWKQAVNMLDSQQLSMTERDLLKDRNKVFTNIWRAIRSGLPANEADQVRYRAASRLLALTFENVLSIVFVESDLRIQWIYNAIRLRLAQGNFVILVSSMVSASAVGTSLFPGAGTYLGMMFGIVGGMMSIFVPERHKNYITYSIKEKWLVLLESFGGGTTAVSLNSGFDDDLHSSASGESLKKILVDCTSYRQKVIDVYLENIYQSYLAILANDEKVKGYRQTALQDPMKNTSNMQSEIDFLFKDSTRAHRKLLEGLNHTVSFYLSEAGRFDSHKLKYSRNPKLVSEFAQEVILNENILAHFCSFSEAILKINYLGLKESSADSGSYLSSIQTICKLTFGPSVAAYHKLPPTDKETHDSVIKFLEKTIWTHFDEQKLTLDRLDDILNLK